MKKMLLPILMVCLSFAQFEAGKKMVGGNLADFTMDMFTWNTSNTLLYYTYDIGGYEMTFPIEHGLDEVSLVNTNVELMASGSYFVIDNLALSVGLKYPFSNATWQCDGEECEEEFTWTLEEIFSGTGGTPDETLNPFGFMIGAQYHMGSTYGAISFNDWDSENDADAYLAFGGGYMHELASGVYLDVGAEYRLSLAGDNTPPSPEGLVPDGSLADALTSGAGEATAMSLVGTVGVTVVF
ncbi:MAG: hypothetical protein CL748_04185 [Chloroflexi bacterium]|nr:hypothetical protein [Chloroflexota bacterium]